MDALREWLIQHEWFILFCDPSPTDWLIKAISPDGRYVMFTGTREKADVLQ